jgi:hypothetical protein
VRLARVDAIKYPALQARLKQQGHEILGYPSVFVMKNGKLPSPLTPHPPIAPLISHPSLLNSHPP